jgi:hypothetical protein
LIDESNELESQKSYLKSNRDAAAAEKAEERKEKYETCCTLIMNRIICEYMGHEMDGYSTRLRGREDHHASSYIFSPHRETTPGQ